MDTYSFTVVNRPEAAIQAKWADRLEVGRSGPSRQPDVTSASLPGAVNEVGSGDIKARFLYEASS
jgi:hypothetical protein